MISIPLTPSHGTLARWNAQHERCRSRRFLWRTRERGRRRCRRRRSRVDRHAQEAGAYDAAVLTLATQRQLRSAAARSPERARSLRDAGRHSHNTQPWRFRLSDRFDLGVARFGKTVGVRRPDNHHLFASLGCARKPRSGGSGLRPSRNREFRRRRRGINVDLEKSPPATSPLFAAIPTSIDAQRLRWRAVPVEHLRFSKPPEWRRGAAAALHRAQAARGHSGLSRRRQQR